jgi:hypothetical protein
VTLGVSARDLPGVGAEVRIGWYNAAQSGVIGEVLQILGASEHGQYFLVMSEK